MNSDEARIAFINAVHAHPAIWDHKHKSHHNRFVLDKLWDEVAAECKIEKPEARKKWKVLRDKFRVEMQKIVEARATNTDADAVDLSLSIKIEPEEESTWPFFQYLQFLREQFSSRKNGNSNDGDNSISNEENNGNSGHEPPIYYPTIEFDPVKTDWQENSWDSIPSTPTPDSVKEIINRFRSPSPPGQAEAVRKLETTVEELQQKVKELEELKTRQSAEEASAGDLAFFRSLLPHIAKLEDSQRMSLLMDIQRCVYERVYWTPGAPDFQEGSIVPDAEADPLQTVQKLPSSTKRKRPSAKR